MTEQERKNYVDFMCNIENAHKCDRCPENHNFNSYNSENPCGQQNCWVVIHCSYCKKEA